MTDRHALLRQRPAIDRLLGVPPLAQLATGHPHVQLREAPQRAVEEMLAKALGEALAN